MLPMQEARVRSLVGELGSHLPHSAAKNFFKKKLVIGLGVGNLIFIKRALGFWTLNGCFEHIVTKGSLSLSL